MPVTRIQFFFLLHVTISNNERGGGSDRTGRKGVVNGGLIADERTKSCLIASLMQQITTVVCY